MNKETLNKNNRISEVAKFIDPYKIIADIGCDHGFLVIEAFENYHIDKAYAVDNKEGPLNQAIHNIKNKPYYKNVVFSLSSGIEEIGEDTECVVIAGMGGILITEILDKPLKNVKRLILEPNRDQEDVRKKVVSLGFDIVNEEVIFDKGKYYEIIVCDKVDNLDKNKYSDIEYEFGPILLKEKSLLFREKWFMIYDSLKDIKDEKVQLRVERIKKIL